MIHNPPICAACGKQDRRKARLQCDCPFCHGRVCLPCCTLAREVVWALHRLDTIGGSGTMTAMSEDRDNDTRRWPTGEAIRECVKLGLMDKMGPKDDWKMYQITDKGRKFLEENPL